MNNERHLWGRLYIIYNIVTYGKRLAHVFMYSKIREIHGRDCSQWLISIRHAYYA